MIVFDRLAAREPSTLRVLAARGQRVRGRRPARTSRPGPATWPARSTSWRRRACSSRRPTSTIPNPRPQITLREWHLTATTPAKAKTVEFVTLYRPHRAAQAVPRGAKLTRIDGGYVLTAELSDGRVTALLPTDDAATLSAEGLQTTGAIVVWRQWVDGMVQTLDLGE